MFKKNIFVCLFISLVFIGKASFAQEESPNVVAPERHIVEIDFSSWVRESFTVSPDIKRVAYAAQFADS